MGLDVFNTCFHGGVPAAWRRAASIEVYSAARTVICISGKVQRLLTEGMSETVHSALVYNGTDTDLFSPALDAAASQEGMEILIVGNLLAGKGHELVFRSMHELQKTFPKLRCRVIGEGADRGRFEALVHELRIAERVHFEGTRSRAAVADAMRACSVFVLPSKYEGLGCAYLEAMACGKPVIACRGQGIDEIIEHGRNGWLVPGLGDTRRCTGRACGRAFHVASFGRSALADRRRRPRNSSRWTDVVSSGRATGTDLR